MAEQQTLNLRVLGSIPRRLTILLVSESLPGHSGYERVDIGSPGADDGFMGRALLVATFLVVSTAVASAQAPSTLHITVTLTDATGKTTPVARYALLISEEPPTLAPRRILTTLAGTADVSLHPGRYAVESDQPVAFESMSYEWAQRIDVVAGRDATLELTAGNASGVNEPEHLHNVEVTAIQRSVLRGRRLDASSPL